MFFDTIQNVTDAKKNIDRGRREKESAVRRLENVLDGSQRGNLLISQIKDLYAEQHTGINTMNAVNQLFATLKKAKLDPCEGVRILNDEILKRHRASGTGKNVGLALSAMDIRRARQRVDKEPLPLQHEQLTKSELMKSGLTLSSTGLLVRGSYSDEMFPTFADEEALEVSVESAAEGESSYAGPSRITPIRSGNPSVVTTPTRKAKSTYYPHLSTPGSRKRKRAHQPSRKVVSVDCDCYMDSDWKNDVEFEIRNLPHRRVLEILEELTLPGSGGEVCYVCQGHLELLCTSLYIIAGPDPKEQLIKVYHKVQDRHSMRKAWRDMDTRDFFHQTPMIAAERNAAFLGMSNYNPEKKKTEIILHPWSEYQA